MIAEGPAAIFKFSLAILLSKKSELMALDGFECVADYIKNHLNNVENVNTVRSLVETASQMQLGNRLDIYATEYAVLSENDLLREPGQNWSPSKNIVKDLRLVLTPSDRPNGHFGDPFSVLISSRRVRILNF